MRFWVSIVVLALCGCGGGGGGGAAMPPPPTTTTQSIAGGTLTAPATNGASWTMKFSGTIPADETATVTSQIPNEIVGLESGHTVGAGFTITVGPGPVDAVLDVCGGGFSGGSVLSSSNNPVIVFYDAGRAPAIWVAKVFLATPHSAVLCVNRPPPGAQTLVPGRQYVVLEEV
jgi:hypothetical protein